MASAAAASWNRSLALRVGIPAILLLSLLVSWTGLSRDAAGALNFVLFSGLVWAAALATNRSPAWAADWTPQYALGAGAMAAGVFVLSWAQWLRVAWAPRALARRDIVFVFYPDTIPPLLWIAASVCFLIGVWWLLSQPRLLEVPPVCARCGAPAGGGRCSKCGAPF